MERWVQVFLFMIFAWGVFYSCVDKNNSSFFTDETKDTLRVPQYDDHTFKTAYKAIVAAKENKSTARLAKIYFEMGYYYLGKNRSDSAYYYFNHSKEEFSLIHDTSFVAKNFINMAIAQKNEGDYYGSEETVVEALKLLKTRKDFASMAFAYNILAISKADQKDYSQAKEYYNQSLLFSQDSVLNVTVKNNQAVVDIKAKNYSSAIKTLSELLNNPFLDQHPKDWTRVVDNLAYARWLSNSSYNAEPEFYRALQIREKDNDLLGQTASHSHLSEYFTRTDPKNAISHAERMYKVATQLESPDDRLEALEKLTLLENPVQANKYFSIYLRINDSLQTARSHAKNQFALIRYEVEKNKEENLQLKAENAQKNYQIFRQRVIVFSIIAITLSGGILLWFWYKRRKEKFRQEKMEEVHRTELKYSKKIHDEVANGIYYLMVQLENNFQMEKTAISDSLERLYHKSRNISHESELKSDIKNDFSTVLRNMLQPYGGEDIKIIIIGNEPHLWEKVSANKKEEIYYVLIELMTNMKKHSKASLVTLKFKQENNTITIDYFDNGIGLVDKNWKSNRGLKNMETRINSIQGKFYLDKGNKKGFSVKMTVTI